jgi:adenylate cyclase
LVVFFSDIENFTSIAEKMDPTELMEQVCEYFEVLTQVIFSQKGTIDKYIGDSIMAFWGAPVPEEAPCDHAARAALLCQKKIAELNAKWDQQGRPKFVTRIGLHKGEAIVGNLGSIERLNYTAIGDTINISSRLESINKVYHTFIIVSDVVYEEIKDRFILRMIDRVIVKGRTHAISIYELLGEELVDIPFDVKAYQAEFAQGFTAYKNHQWQEAILYFQRCLSIFPKDTVAPIFIKRCTQKLKTR